MELTSSPKQGLNVIHLFFKVNGSTSRSEILAAIDKLSSLEEAQIVTVSMLGHKSDLAIMALSPNMWQLRDLQTSLRIPGLELAESYLSLTEVSEYADGLPEEMKQTRLYPNLPPEGKDAWCFYPMSKRRNPGQNWYTTPFEERKTLMHQHGASGKAFRGRIIQLITGSTGLDEFEWGVTLFGQHPDDLKDAVYTMRFDEASAEFAEFGSFYVGNVATPEVVLNSIGIV